MQPQVFAAEGWLEKSIVFLIACLEKTLRENGEVLGSPDSTQGLSAAAAPGSRLSARENLRLEVPIKSVCTCSLSVFGDNNDAGSHNAPVSLTVTLRAIGNLALIVKQRIEPYVSRLLPHVLKALQQDNRPSTKHKINDDTITFIKQNVAPSILQMLSLDDSKQGVEHEALSCIIKLVQATGHGMIERIPLLIRQMCSGMSWSHVVVSLPITL